MAAGTFDAIGSTELQDAGKAGLIQVQGKISAVLGTVLICECGVSVSSVAFSCHISCFMLVFLNDWLVVA